LPAQLLPKSETVTLGDAPAATDNHSLAAVVERWRGRVAKPRLGGATDEAKQVAAALSDAPQLQPQQQPPQAPQSQAQPQPQPAALDPNRFKLLRRPLDPAAPDPLRR
jgi:hypothetical protein